MPSAKVNGITLYYEAAGRGPAVVLIGGLGADGHFWYKQVAALVERFTVVTPDNRGAGRSDKPDGPYTTWLAADDIRGLLDALELPVTHVVGASLGGFIAQEFVLAYPERVGRLVLCCTSFGGPHSIPIAPETVQVLLNRSGDPERDLRVFLPVQVATDYLETHAAEVDAYVAWRVAHPQPMDAYQHQLAASLSHNTEERLPALRCPVLIMHGAQDRVVPAGNAALLAQRIAGARLHIFPDAGHLFLWERADEANRVITEFLAEEA